MSVGLNVKGSAAKKVGDLCLSWQSRSVAYGIVDFASLNRSLLTNAAIFLSLCTSYLSTSSSDQDLHIEIHSGLISNIRKGL
jgi:hypothetical protein